MRNIEEIIRSRVSCVDMLEVLKIDTSAKLGALVSQADLEFGIQSHAQLGSIDLTIWKTARSI